MVSDLNILVWKWSKIAKKKFFFLADFALQNKVETTLPGGLETSGRRVYRYFAIFLDVVEFFAFLDNFFHFRFLGYSWSTRKQRFLMD